MKNESKSLTRMPLATRDAVINLSLINMKPFLLITSMPKTGSTFLLDLLSSAFNLRRLTLIGAHRSEHNLDWLAAVYGSRFSTVSRVHSRATYENMQLISKYSIRTVVLVRNIFDVVVSLRDHLERESLVTPMTYFDSNLLTMSIEEQLDAIIDLFVPWNLSFYASWYEMAGCVNIDPIWITYESLSMDKHKTILDIASHFSIDVSTEKVNNTVKSSQRKKKSLRFNKGISGRGKDILTQQQIQRVKNFANHYPSIDFSLIGLHN